MSIDATILRRLAALKLPGEAFQEVLAIIAEVQSKEDEKRHRARERTSRWRQNNIKVASPERHSERHSDNVHIDTSLTSLSSLPKERKIKKERKVSIYMPEDWTPSAACLEFATSRGWPKDHALAEAQRFKDHGLSSGKTYRDLDAAWRNWVTSPYQAVTPKARGSPTAPPRPGSREDRAERTHNALVELRNFAKGGNSHDTGGGGEPSEHVAGFLPFDKLA